MKWHIREDGVVRECEARAPEFCPVKNPLGEPSEHYSTEGEAKMSSEKILDREFGKIQTLSKRRESAGKVEKSPERRRERVFLKSGGVRQFGLRKKLPENIIRGLEKIPNKAAYGLTGSQLYGLATPDSDYDVIVIVKDKVRTKQLLSEDQDFQVVSLSDFLYRYLQRSSVPETLMVQSGEMEITDPNYRGVIESLNFSSNNLYINLNAYSHKHLQWLYKAERNPSRVEKTLRTIARNSFFAEKLLRERREFTPVLTPDERSVVEKLSSDSSALFKDGAEFEELMDFFKIPHDSKVESRR